MIDFRPKILDLRKKIATHNGQYRGRCVFEETADAWHRELLVLNTQIELLYDLYYEQEKIKLLQEIN